MKKRLLLFLVIFCLGCSRDKNPVKPADGEILGFYFLADETRTLYNLGDTPVEQLERAEHPWLTANDILTYDFPNHTIHLENPIKRYITVFKDSEELMQKWNVKPFVVVANGEQCYIAAFHPGYSSLGRFVPYIDLISVDIARTRSFVLQQAWADVDVRDDPRVERALKSLGKYRSSE